MGLDNKIWGTELATRLPNAGDKKIQFQLQAVYRFTPDAENMEHLAQPAHLGLGSENFDVFISTGQ